MKQQPVLQRERERVKRRRSLTEIKPYFYKSNPRHNFLGFILLFLFITTATPGACLANNVAVENVLLVDQDIKNNTYDIKFDIAWDNSWRIAGAPSAAANWDAAWVFAKYSVYDSATSTWGNWAHCTLLNSGNVTPAGSQMAFGATDSVYKGVFIYRSSSGTGTADWNNAEIRWDYGTDGVADNAKVKVIVFAIEMVLIPQGSFSAGDTDNDNTNCFYEGGTTSTFNIASEGAITVANTAGNLYYDADNIYSGDQSGPIPAAFPKGFSAFYIMKYKISQRQYVEFLNTLTSVQQNTRTASQTANQYAMANAATVTNRSGIRCPSTITAGVVITFGCDLDGDGVFNESDDGQWLACNYLQWMDVAAYADWAGLRPFTELEFEKACRGGQAAVDDEYAWGDGTIAGSAYTLSNTGTTSEGIATNYSTTKGNSSYSTTDGNINGPLRCGIFAANSGNTGRMTAGASYYGVMELSGNLWERPVTVGNTTSGTTIGGREFTGTHGDGALTTLTSYEGNATNSDWPGYNTSFATRGITGARGSGFRGGSWNSGVTYARVSDRGVAASTSTGRDIAYGGRCARTSP